MKDTIICSAREFSADVGKLLLRITLAVAIFPHGAQKVLGVFGGNGLSATWTMFTEKLDIAAPFAAIAIFTEFVGPILLVLGVFPRLLAGMLAVLMTVAAQYGVKDGFFMNWSGTQAGEGAEYHVLFIGAALALMMIGGGRFSLLRLVGECDDDARGNEKTAADDGVRR